MREFICPREYVIFARKFLPRGRMIPQYEHQTSPPNPTHIGLGQFSFKEIKMAKSTERTHILIAVAICEGKHCEDSFRT